MMAIAGCSSGQAASTPARPSAPAPTASPDANRLKAALLPPPKGMRIAYGPETGAFGSLKSTQQGLQAMRQSKLSRPECAGAAQLDAAKPEVGRAPAAVIAFTSTRGSITQALVSLPHADFPGALPKQCTRYQATVEGAKVVYTTRELPMPKQGDQSRAFVTTASGATNAQIGSVVIRRSNVIMSLLVVGRQVKPDGLFELGRIADQTLARVTR